MRALPPSAEPAIQAGVLLQLWSERDARLVVRIEDKGRFLLRSPETWFMLIRGLIVAGPRFRVINGGPQAAFVQSMAVVALEDDRFFRFRGANDAAKEGSAEP